MTESRFFLLWVADPEPAAVEDLGTDARRATKAYDRAERDGEHVVLLSAASEDDLRRTHSSYFGGPALPVSR